MADPRCARWRPFPATRRLPGATGRLRAGLGTTGSWGGEDRLGWVDLPLTADGDMPRAVRLREELLAEGFERLVVVAMGGSAPLPPGARFGNSPRPRTRRGVPGQPRTGSGAGGAPARPPAAHGVPDRLEVGNDGGDARPRSGDLRGAAGHRRRPRQAVPRGHRSRHAAPPVGRRGRLPGAVRREEERGWTVLGAQRLRTAAGGPGRVRAGTRTGRRPPVARGTGPGRRRGGPGLRAGRAAGPAAGGGPLAGGPLRGGRPRRDAPLAGTALLGEHREGRNRDPAGGPAAAAPPGEVGRRDAVHPPRRRRRRRPGAAGGRRPRRGPGPPLPGGGRAAAGHLPLAGRGLGGRLPHGGGPLRPARRRGHQGGGAPARRGSGGRSPAPRRVRRRPRGFPCLRRVRRARDQRLRSPEPVRRSAAPRAPAAGSPRASGSRPQSGSGRRSCTRSARSKRAGLRASRS